MATLTIRNLDERTKAQLRIRAARHGRSMEEEARWYAELLHRRERMGRPMATADAMIASTALAHEAAVATRDGAGERDGADRGQAHPSAAPRPRERREATPPIRSTGFHGVQR
jgi:plasmid stability protein